MILPAKLKICKYDTTSNILIKFKMKRVVIGSSVYTELKKLFCMVNMNNFFMSDAKNEKTKLTESYLTRKA